MALETATYPAQLVTTNPTASDPLSQADDHIRMLKTVVQNAAAGPAFAAYQSVLQSIASGTSQTKVQLQTEEFDTAAAFDSATNFRFTPLVAGYYQVNWSVGFVSPVSSLTTSLYKNGGRAKDGNLASTGTISGGSALVSMNGTTDFLEIFVSQSSGSAVNTSAASNQTYFQAHLARLA